MAGSGISGLTAAFHLAHLPGVDVNVVEAAATFGGRANVTADGEHCARLFLSDYHELFAVLSQIPSPMGGSVRASLRPVRRMCHTASKDWTEISHLYPVLAREFTLRERLEIVRSTRRPAILSERVFGPNENRLGSRKNYSLRSQIALGASLLKSRTAYALQGPTDEMLIRPWIEHLCTLGVSVRSAAQVTTFAANDTGVMVGVDGAHERYDAVVLTMYPSDLAAVLDRSNICHSLRLLGQTHLYVFTIDLDPAEEIVGDGDPALYSRFGITVELQPRAARAIAVCTKPVSTEKDYVVARVREMLCLQHPVVSVRHRANHEVNEAIFMAEYIDIAKVVRPIPPHVFFAGSCMRNSYPGDSGEGAARSAKAAVDQLVSRYGLERRRQ